MGQRLGKYFSMLIETRREREIRLPRVLDLHDKSKEQAVGIVSLLGKLVEPAPLANAIDIPLAGCVHGVSLYLQEPFGFRHFREVFKM